MNDSQSQDWKLFQGRQSEQSEEDYVPHDDIDRLPDPPQWRAYASDSQAPPIARQAVRGRNFFPRQEEVEMVNAALYLRRPLLVTGNPGTGKTSLAYAIAYELGLGEVLYWPITTRTTLKDGLYSYDPVGRLQDAELHKDDDNYNPLDNIGKYLRLGPLGTALMPETNGSTSSKRRPRILLIDEIDKSDIDLPNDLLHVFEEGQFDIPELVRIGDEVKKPVSVRTAYRDPSQPQYFEVPKGRVACNQFPVVLMTSNGERDFPPAFLRRCLRLTMKNPDGERLSQIVSSQIQDLDSDVAQLVEDLVQQFATKRDSEENPLATDQLLNAIYLVTRNRNLQEDTDTKERLITKLFKVLSSTEDITR